ncbi:MAG: glycosyltransferase [Thermomicrobia bacterium]|nr:glycosyltransferase [Thermomicrobia bacterium]
MTSLAPFVLPPSVRRVAMLAVHTSPLARIGGPSAGGMNIYVRELARELAARGARVDIFTRREDADTPTRTLLEPGVCLIALPCGPFGDVEKLSLVPFLSSFAAAVDGWANENRRTYDLIHAHYWLSGIVGDALRCRWDVPLLMTFHTLAQAKNTVARSIAENEATQRIVAERRLMHSVDAVMAFNPQEKAEMTWYYGAEPGKVCVVPAGVDTTLFRPGDRAAARRLLDLLPDEPVILFVGRIDPIKGIDVLVDALCGLRCEMWQTAPPRLLLVGGGEGEPGYETLIARAAAQNLLDRIDFVGSLSHAELPIYYQAADVVAVPSFYESFGLVAVEAMACGTPVVASRAGGLAFTVDDNRTGFLVPHNDPHALAARLHAVLADAAVRDRLGAQATVVAQRYGWPVIASRVVHIYDRLIRGYRLDLCNEAPARDAMMTGGS